jgi:hypothetical protein
MGTSVPQRIFGGDIEGNRVANRENPGGYLTSVCKRGQKSMDIQKSLAIWEGPRQTQEQLDRRIADISSRVEPLNAEFADFLAQYSKEEMLVITLGLAPVESACFRLWALVFHQGGRRMTLAEKEHPGLRWGLQTSWMLPRQVTTTPFTETSTSLAGRLRGSRKDGKARFLSPCSVTTKNVEMGRWLTVG